MKLTAGQAAKQTGKSIPTIVRAFAKGTLSGEKLPDGGGYLFEPSELFRVFPPVSSNTNDTPPALGHETPNDTGALEVEVRLLRERLADKDAVIDDLRQDRDHWREQAERTTRLLPAPVPPAAPAPAAVAERPSLVARLIGALKRQSP